MKTFSNNADHMRKKSLVPLSRSFLKAAESASKLNSALANNIELDTPVTDLSKEAIEAKIKAEEVARKSVKDYQKVDSIEAAAQVAEKAAQVLLNESGQQNNLNNAVNSIKNVGDSVSNNIKKSEEAVLKKKSKELTNSVAINNEWFKKFSKYSAETQASIIDKYNKSSIEVQKEAAENIIGLSPAEVTKAFESFATPVESQSTAKEVTKETTTAYKNAQEPQQSTAAEKKAASEATTALNQNINNLIDQLASGDENSSLVLNIDGIELARHLATNQVLAAHNLQLVAKHS